MVESTGYKGRLNESRLLTLHFEREDAARLAAVSEACRVSGSELIRRAVRGYLASLDGTASDGRTALSEALSQLASQVAALTDKVAALSAVASGQWPAASEKQKTIKQAEAPAPQTASRRKTNLNWL